VPKGRVILTASASADHSARKPLSVMFRFTWAVRFSLHRR